MSKGELLRRCLRKCRECLLLTRAVPAVDPADLAVGIDRSHQASSHRGPVSKDRDRTCRDPGRKGLRNM